MQIPKNTDRQSIKSLSVTQMTAIELPTLTDATVGKASESTVSMASCSMAKSLVARKVCLVDCMRTLCLSLRTQTKSIIASVDSILCISPQEMAILMMQRFSAINIDDAKILCYSLGLKPKFALAKYKLS
jgi:hypothetical protein